MDPGDPRETQARTLELRPDIGKPGMPSPPKTWAECGIEEKVERLREALIGARYDVAGMSEAQYAMSRELGRYAEHQHAATGEVFIPLRSVRQFDVTYKASGRGFDPLA